MINLKAPQKKKLLSPALSLTCHVFKQITQALVFMFCFYSPEPPCDTASITLIDIKGPPGPALVHSLSQNYLLILIWHLTFWTSVILSDSYFVPHFLLLFCFVLQTRALDNVFSSVFSCFFLIQMCTGWPASIFPKVGQIWPSPEPPWKPLCSVQNS